MRRGLGAVCGCARVWTRRSASSSTATKRLFNRARTHAHPTWHPHVDELFDPHSAVFDFDDPRDRDWGERDSDDDFDVDDPFGLGA